MSCRNTLPSIQFVVPGDDGLEGERALAQAGDHRLTAGRNAARVARQLSLRLWVSLFKTAINLNVAILNLRNLPSGLKLIDAT